MNFFGIAAESAKAEALRLGKAGIERLGTASNFARGLGWIGLGLNVSDAALYREKTGHFAPGAEIDAFFSGLALVPGADIASGLYAAGSLVSFIMTSKSLGQNLSENFIFVGGPAFMVIPRADGPLFNSK